MDHTGVLWRGDALVFGHPDPDHRLAGVRLVSHAGLPRDRLDFSYDEAAGRWRLVVPPPHAWRLEYKLELRHPDGSTETISDPNNPRRVGSAFGEHSVVARDDYTEPRWLRAPAADGSWRELALPSRALDAEVWSRIWSPTGPTGHVLVAHDGPEYDKLAELGHFSAAQVAAGHVPPHHLVLLAPGHRNEWYSANPAYAQALAREVLPRLHAELGTAGPVVGLGASLGGLAMLHAQRRFPRAFAGLFLQSSSFFRPRLDRQESRFPWFGRIVRFTGRVVGASSAPQPVPMVLTCGLAEENLGNNREMAYALRRQQYPVTLVEVPDAHNFTGWRDALDPHLTGLLRHIWE